MVNIPYQIVHGGVDSPFQREFYVSCLQLLAIVKMNIFLQIKMIGDIICLFVTFYNLARHNVFIVIIGQQRFINTSVYIGAVAVNRGFGIQSADIAGQCNI